jgi:hypothetical protein
MLDKIKRAISDPFYALHVFKDRYLDSLRRCFLNLKFGSKLFSHAVEYRSASDNGQYPAVVAKAVKNQRNFENFKRFYAYREILEHVSREQGERYLQILTKRNDGILSNALESVLISDSIGNPIKFSYENINILLSPTTLRYVKVASDLKILFGEELNSVAEIGCGYGGQCLVNEKLLRYKRFTLFDLPFVNQLIKRYLDYTLMDGSYEVATINEKPSGEYDLAISNYAFSELPRELQRVYIKKVLAKSQRGYLTMNSGIGGSFDDGRLTIVELRKLLPHFECFEESPLTGQHNYIIVWGHNPNSENDFFTRMKI